ncbi:hypothetical protein [Viridibacillus soli]|nr:hypothetical protein [Viridibacillus soli]
MEKAMNNSGKSFGEILRKISSSVVGTAYFSNRKRAYGVRAWDLCF